MTTTTTTSSNPINVPVGTSCVDKSVAPYMRGREVEFTASNLRPNRPAQFFLNDINITRFVQRCSTLVMDNANTVFGYLEGERLYCNATHAYASVVSASPNNSLYLNENYLTINVAAVGANSFSASDYAIGDVVYQSPALTPSSSKATFEAQVVYWNASDKVLALQPLTGTLSSNSVANSLAILSKSGADHIVYAANVVNGNMFPAGSVISSLDNVANRFLVNSWDHRSGAIIDVHSQPNANCIILAGTAPSDAVGNILFLSANTGLGQGGLILSVSGNVVYTNTAFSPYATGNTYYSIGQSVVDDIGVLSGVLNIPETDTVRFLTGSATFTISDSTIVDDPDATMIATGTYLAQGYIGFASQQTPIVNPTTTPAPAAPPIVPQSATSRGSVPNPSTATAAVGPNTTYAGVVSLVAANTLANGLYNNVDVTSSGWGTFSADPLAQLFFTPAPKKIKSNQGIFVSSIDLWFSQKPSASSPRFPVQVKIVETENGYPTSKVIASSQRHWSHINTSVVPDSANVGSLIDKNLNATKFKFEDPVYLLPSTQYGIVVYTESPDYELFVSEVGAVDITSGSLKSRISSMPYAGAFFRAQNASTWRPIQNQTLMFVVNKAVFSTAPVSVTFNMHPIKHFVAYDTLLVHSVDATFAPTQLTYKALTTLANTFSPESAYRQYTKDTHYNFGHDLSISSASSIRRRVILPGQNSSIVMQVSMQSNDPDVSPIFNAEHLSVLTTGHMINNGCINPENITIITRGVHSNAANITVTISPPDLAGGIQATANVMFLNGNNVTYINILNQGGGYSVSPTITISEPGVASNATAVVCGEDGKFGGNGIVRYVTREITLANGFDSGDLRVFLNAIRPVGTNVLVYYKVLSATDTQGFVDLPWVPMVLVNDLKSPDQLTPVQLVYCPSLGPNGLPSGTLSYFVGTAQYPLGGKFKHFAIKIVLFAGDSTVVPSVQGMTTIALPAG